MGGRYKGKRKDTFCGGGGKSGEEGKGGRILEDGKETGREDGRRRRWRTRQREMRKKRSGEAKERDEERIRGEN